MGKGVLGKPALNEHKRRIAAAVVSRFAPEQIRERSLANLRRWKAQGAWGSDYDVWQRILTHGSDADLISVMLNGDERSEQLRQSPPYVGLLPREVVHTLNAWVAGSGKPPGSDA